jgi:hypothetical protein
MRSPRRSGKSAGSHGPQAKTNVAPRQVRPSSVSIRSRKVADAATDEIADEDAHRAARHQHAAVRLEDRRVAGVEYDLRPARRELRLHQPLVRDADPLERRQRRGGKRIGSPRQPQHAGLMKERRGGALRERLPLLQRIERPARVDFLGAVAHANQPRVAAGAGAAVGRAVRVDEHDVAAGTGKMVRGPRAETSGPDDSDR